MKKLVSVFVTCALVLGLVLTATPALAQGGTVTGDKTLSETDIACNGSLDATLTLVGETGIAGEPEDIMLVLDRSGSMAGQPLANLKTAANLFVDIIDEATDGSLNGVIANGSRIGMVSFTDTASLVVPLTTNANTVKAAINALVNGNMTDIGDAIQIAQTELAGSQPTNSKDMLLVSDGEWNVGPDPGPIAAAARAAGTQIFCIGFGSVNVANLNAWATDPDSTHVFIAPDSSGLQAIFQTIGAAITVPAATNITVVDTVDNHFSVSNPAASKGTVVQTGNVLTWTIDELGTETVTLTYTATHDCSKAGGVETVNDSVVYSDTEGHSVTFPNPTVNVRGCAAALALTPKTATNELSEDNSHSVTATLTDDFGDGVVGKTVNFSITSGPNAGKTGSAVTNASGQATFSYTTVKDLAHLGMDVITATVSATCGVPVTLSDTAKKSWVDTIDPLVSSIETTNPAGKKIPPAGSTTLPGPKGGMNEDGFYLLTAKDNLDPNPQIYVFDRSIWGTWDGVYFGPFTSGTNVKFTEDPTVTPVMKAMGGPTSAVPWHIILPTDAVVFALDASGNWSSPDIQLVPPPPK